MSVYHRIRAFIGGYFWLPCPVCGKHFGGHQTSGTAYWWNGSHYPSYGEATCPDHPGSWLYVNGKGFRPWNEIPEDEMEELRSTLEPILVQVYPHARFLEER